KMNLELLRIWEEAKKTIVFVTHGITEAVFLGTRVIVLTAGPAHMADNFRVELPHPRTLEMKTNEAFGEYTRRIYRLLGMEGPGGRSSARYLRHSLCHALGVLPSPLWGGVGGGGPSADHRTTPHPGASRRPSPQGGG